MADNLKTQMLMGKNKILLFRDMLEDGAEGAKLAFQTEHTFSLTRDADAIVTKDGTVQKLSELEGEVSGIEAVQSKKDSVAKMLMTAMIEGRKLELWEVTVDEELKEGKTYPAMYAQGYLTTWESENPAEDEAVYSGDFMIDLIPQFGMATLTEDQQDAVQYEFADTTEALEG